MLLNLSPVSKIMRYSLSGLDFMGGTSKQTEGGRNKLTSWFSLKECLGKSPDYDSYRHHSFGRMGGRGQKAHYIPSNYTSTLFNHCSGGPYRLETSIVTLWTILPKNHSGRSFQRDFFNFNITTLRRAKIFLRSSKLWAFFFFFWGEQASEGSLQPAMMKEPPLKPLKYRSEGGSSSNHLSFSICRIGVWVQVPVFAQSFPEAIITSAVCRHSPCLQFSLLWVWEGFVHIRSPMISTWLGRPSQL